MLELITEIEDEKCLNKLLLVMKNSGVRVVSLLSSKLITVTLGRHPTIQTTPKVWNQVVITSSYSKLIEPSE